MAEATIGVIGGSGLYEIERLTNVTEVAVETPFGAPSDRYAIGTLGETRVAFLPRHGKGHSILPTDLPVAANIYGFKALGVERILSISAVGSLREEIAPLHLVVPDQLIDRTKGRRNTLFGDGLVVHCSFADPFCPDLSQLVCDQARATGATVHMGGTLVVMEGPLFSTKAESNLYRQWGGSIIGMTALPEAKFAREAEICYATLACVTDYDVWHETHDDVSVEMIVANLLHNVEVSKQVIAGVVQSLPAERTCGCQNALENAVMTAPQAIPGRVKDELAPILSKYFPS